MCEQSEVRFLCVSIKTGQQYGKDYRQSCTPKKAKYYAAFLHTSAQDDLCSKKGKIVISS